MKDSSLTKMERRSTVDTPKDNDEKGFYINNLNKKARSNPCFFY